MRNFRQANTFYPAASLLKTIAYDENNNASVTYRDKAGRKVMAEMAGRKTYYLYDDFGNTVQVIPPIPAGWGHSTTGNIHTTASISNQSFRYTYDANTMLMADKYVPGLNTTNKYFYAYDRLERLVMVTDAKGFKTVTKYDILNRPILTGRYTGTATPQPTDGLFENKTTTGHFYTANLSFPATLTAVYTVNYYDNYDFDDNNTANVAYTAAPVGTPYAASAYLAVRGKMTGAKAGILKQDQTAPTQFLASYPFYDKWGRVIHLRADHHLGATPDLVWNAYNFQGWLTNTRKAHVATINAVNHNYVINERFTYDHAGRMVNSYHKMGDAGVEVRTANQTYNELGQLSVKKMHESATANTFLQDVNYSYNIRSWMEQINDFSTAADLFALKLTYKEGDDALDAAYAGGANANYNGNITMLEWKASGSATQRVQGFRYDGLNRLANVQYAERNGGALTVNQNHNETLTYDDNGNILGLTRRGLLSGTSTFGLIDNLTYTYTNNRLSSIAEGASTAKGFKTGGAYSYDANGNMTTDAGKGMTVVYNFLNLPQYVSFNSGSEITLNYTATGQKLTKVSGTATKHYANGIEYNNTALEAVYFSEGRVVPGSPWKYQYALKDHLGNGRVWFEPNSANTAPVVTQQSHYYAFGMEMEALTSASAPNKYRYNGKELNEDFGLNWSDYGARWYDAAVGRWWVVDDLGSHANQMDKSPYAYAWNNPVILTDPDGNLPSNPQERNDCCNHLLGGLRAVGGLLQMAGGTALALAPEPTGLTKVGAGIAIGHGLDDFQAGIRQAFTGENTESLTFTTTKSAAQALGANENIAGKIATGTDIGLGFAGGGVFTKAATSRVATSEVVGQTVFHATSKEGAALNILNGINPKFFNPSSRFGRGFYVAKEQSTMLAELAHHGANPVNTISFSLSGGKFLNATSPLMDLGTKYIPLTLSGAARNMGYNGIIFSSLRNLNGTNAVIFNNFDLLKQGTIIK